MSLVPFVPASDQNMARIAEALESTSGDPSIAESYDNSSTYNIGKCVKHDGILYKCTTAITTPEPWTAAHWREVKLANEVSEVKEKIGNTNLPTTAQTVTGAIAEQNDNIAKLRDGLSYVEDGATIAANAAYTAGKFICWQGEMYRIKATINATVTSGNWTTYLDKMDGMGGALSQINADQTSLNDNIEKLQAAVVVLQRHTRLTDFSLADLQAAAADQNLAKHGLKPGDQKTIDGYTYVIAGPNVMKGTDINTCRGNHIGLIVIPHTTHAWNSSERTDYTSTGSGNRGGGYKNSDLHQYLKTDVLNHCKADLGADHLYAHAKLLGSAVNPTGYNRFGTNSGCTSSWAWEECYISALTESQVYGGIQWSSSGYDTGEANTILPVFAEYKHTEIFGDEYLWLRDVSSASQACLAAPDGYAIGDVGGAAWVAGLILYH